MLQIYFTVRWHRRLSWEHLVVILQSIRQISTSSLTISFKLREVWSHLEWLRMDFHTFQHIYEDFGQGKHRMEFNELDVHHYIGFPAVAR